MPGIRCRQPTTDAGPLQPAKRWQTRSKLQPTADRGRGREGRNAPQPCHVVPSKTLTSIHRHRDLPAHCKKDDTRTRVSDACQLAPLRNPVLHLTVTRQPAGARQPPRLLSPGLLVSHCSAHRMASAIVSELRSWPGRPRRGRCTPLQRFPGSTGTRLPNCDLEPEGLSRQRQTLPEYATGTAACLLRGRGLVWLA